MSEPNQPPPRRRFVIPFGGSAKPAPPLDPPPAGGAPRPVGKVPASSSRGGGCLKIFLAVAIVGVLLLIAAGIGGYLYWSSYKTKPGYSLALVFDAAVNNDQKTFEEMVDTDRISDSLADQATDKALKGYGVELPEPLQAQVRGIVRTFVPGIKTRAHDELIPQVVNKSKGLKGYPFVAMALAVPYVIQITENGNTAVAKAPPEAGNTELTLERNGDRWRVVAIKDDAEVERIVAEVAPKLPKVPQIPNIKLPPGLPKIPGVN
jgi:hypothetical protein